MFGGKEYSEELGLDWYDFGARNYDAAIGRWMNIDPLAENYNSWSPYNFVYNSPLKFTDPTGMGPEDWVERTDADGNKSIVWDENVTSADDKDLKEGGTNR